MQRVASLALVLSGVLLGLLLPRPWVTVDEAEAQGNQVEYVCFRLGERPDEVSSIHVYNPNRTTASVKYSRTTAGGAVTSEDSFDVLPGQVSGVAFALTNFADDPYVSAKFRASQSLLVGGEVLYGTGLVGQYQRPLTCSKLGN